MRNKPVYKAGNRCFAAAGASAKQNTLSLTNLKRECRKCTAVGIIVCKADIFYLNHSILPIKLQVQIPYGARQIRIISQSHILNPI